jgi:hypothetical protein
MFQHLRLDRQHNPFARILFSRLDISGSGHLKSGGPRHDLLEATMRLVGHADGIDEIFYGAARGRGHDYSQPSD